MERLRPQRIGLRCVIIAIVSGALFSLWRRESFARLQSAGSQRLWIEAGVGDTLPGELHIPNAHGKLGMMNTAGPIEMKGHPALPINSVGQIAPPSLQARGSFLHEGTQPDVPRLVGVMRRPLQHFVHRG